MHNLPHRPLIRIHINHPLVDTHLPLVPSIRALTTRTLPRGNLKPAGRQRYRSSRMHACLCGDLLDLTADLIKLQRIRANETNPRLSRQEGSPEV